MNILVAGGAGYVGLATAVALLDARHFVTVYDNLSNGHAKTVLAGAELVVGDTGDIASIERVLGSRSFDAVMDFAAFIEVDASVYVPERYFRNNASNVLTLVETMLRHDVMRLASGAVNPDLGEDHQPECHLIPLVLSCALDQRESVSVYGVDYPCVRDYVHVSDVASAHVLALEGLSRASRSTFNIGNGVGFSVREVIDVARSVCGRPIPMVEAVRRSGDPAVLIANTSSIHDELGWTPRFSALETIVASAWDWHSRHPHGFAN